MPAKRVDGDVDGYVADGLPLGIDTDILVEAQFWRLRDVRNDVRLPTRDGGGRDLQEAGFRRRLECRSTSQEGHSRNSARAALIRRSRNGGWLEWRVLSRMFVRLKKSRSEST
jgi:hypothetical protein